METKNSDTVAEESTNIEETMASSRLQRVGKDDAKQALAMATRKKGQAVRHFSSLFQAPGDGAEAPSRVVISSDMMLGGKNVVSIENTAGTSRSDEIVLARDLGCKTGSASGQEENGDGVTKVFISHVRDCTITIKCKILTGTLEISRCENVLVRIEERAVVPTLQVDLCENIALEFRDSDAENTEGENKARWGDGKNDRIFHAGVSNMSVSLIRNGVVEMETDSHFLEDGATTNSFSDETQFLTSVFDNRLVTREVERSGKSGLSWCKNLKAKTSQELEKEKSKQEMLVRVLAKLEEENKKSVRMEKIEE